jgi:predicted hydrocarbon binding protein
VEQTNGPITKSLLASVIIFLLIITGSLSALAEEKAGVSKVVFYVAWYDVGKEALEGLRGVMRVEKGFLGFKEIDTVFYDPSLITIKEMEKALREAGTYRGTVK